jgi:hypothetical protein
MQKLAVTAKRMRQTNTLPATIVVQCVPIAMKPDAFANVLRNVVKII